jgi:K+/H+ antiporter YhaU regulatory subunit KhtT
MSSDQPSFGDKVRYQVDRFLSWSPLARFLGLFGLSVVLVLFCGTLATLAMPPPSGDDPPFDLFEALWWAMLHVTDTGALGNDKPGWIRLVGIIGTLSGISVVALLIGLVSSTVGDKLDDLRKGKSPVIDDRHTLVLGFGEKIFAILRELREANSNQKHASIVILSEADKEAVETAVRERMGDMQTTRVVVRQGSPFSVHDLRKVGAGRARSIIVLSDESLGHDQGAGAADMGVIKTLLALRRIPGALSTNHAVVELMDGSRRAVIEQLGAGGVETVAMAETLSRMMVQTARQNGLAQVYRDLLSYEGSEFYFKAFPELNGRPFGEAQWKMKGAVVCGVRTPGREGVPAQTRLNPPDDTVLEAGDELLVIAEDDDSFSLTASHAPEVPATFAGATPIERTPERLLVCGSSPKLGDMLKEFDNYVLPGSEAWLMPSRDKEAFTELLKREVGTLKNLRLKYVEGDPTTPDALKKVLSPDFAAAMVVADTTLPSDEADARTVITVLLLRELFGSLGPKRPRLISEILDPRTKDLVEQDYGADFVVSSEMTSMLLAQVSERRDLNAVFADLFDSDGNEIYLKRAACFATVGEAMPWLAVQKVARGRGEVAIGYLKFNATPVINPRQAEVLTFAAEDRVIVISEDDSEAVGDQRGGTLVEGLSPPPPPPPDAEEVAPVVKPPPAIERTPMPARSALVPPTEKVPEVKTVTAGPRLAGPSTSPRLPLPPKPKS